MLTTPRSLPNRSTHRRTRLLRWVVGILGALFVGDLLVLLTAETLWFDALDYLPVLRLRLLTQILLTVLIFLSSAGWFWLNLSVAQTRSHPDSMADGAAPIYLGKLRFRWLLLLSVALSLSMAAMLLSHGWVAIDHWQSNALLSRDSSLSIRFSLESLWQVAQTAPARTAILAIGIPVAVALLVFPQEMLVAVALFMSLGFAIVLSEHWTTVLLSQTPVLFDRADPLFNRDISFYVFRLPALELLQFWLSGLTAIAVISVLLKYLLSGNSLSQGYFPGFSAAQLRHLFRVVGAWMLAIAPSYWLARYELLYTTQGIAYGASYASAKIQLPAYGMLSGLALLLGLFLIWLSISTPRGNPGRDRPMPNRRFSPLTLALVLLIVYWSGAIGVGVVLPGIVQRVVVQPNELVLERPFLEYTIAASRDAYALESIEVEAFNPEDNLTRGTLDQNNLTVKNIRLWDTRPLLETNRQLQQFRLYYRFSDADIDRYTLSVDDGEPERQQVLISARELDYSEIPIEAKTWINEHLIYTHGYGFTVSPVNQVAVGGLPDYLIRDISHVTSNDRVKAAIPTANPRIYYGELTDTHVMVKTKQQELDYPSGSENVYNTYDGKGGVNIGSLWQRLVFARQLRDWRMLLSNDFTPETQVLFRRNIMERVRTIAPFLSYDSDPYLVVADTESPEQTESPAASKNYLYWIIDAYTTSDRYPYSDPQDNGFNYIRNSIKVVVDAYNGSVHFYIADEQDPIIQAWSQIFPGMFESFTDMPAALLDHIRYAQDIFQVQSNALMTYHMTDPQVFYNREDQWRAPMEIYGDEPQLVEPYYLIMKLPNETREEFILLRPFTPAQRTNLVAWLAARSDGANPNTPDANRYGKMLLYQFPKEELAFGPEQIEARINQDPLISEQISLWNRQGARAIQGNLLVIPIEQSLLYIEPLYLEAEYNRLPTLVRVIVVYENRIVMAETLEEGLAAIFQPEPEPPAIIRSVEPEVAP